VTIDGIRVAMKKEDWNDLKLKENEWHRRRNRFNNRWNNP
jgi:hypothetical protein